MSVTLRRTGGDRLWLTLIGMPAASGRGRLYDNYKEVSRAARVKKPNESQKAKALWEMKAARDGGDDFYDPERKDKILGRSKTRLELWEEHLKDPIVALDKALKCVENPNQD